MEQGRASSDLNPDPLAPLLHVARDLMLDVRPLSFVSSDPGTDICRTADAMHASMILLGAHKPLLLEGTLGGTVRDVIQSSRIPSGSSSLLIELAHRVSPFLSDYIEQVPEAGPFFLEVAHRRLDAAQLAELHTFLEQRFHVAGVVRKQRGPAISDLLTPGRVVLRLSCANVDDLLEIVAGRFSAVVLERQGSMKSWAVVAFCTSYSAGPENQKARLRLPPRE